MEGGAIDVNGRGSLLATEECLLSETQARNPGLDRAGLEQIFAEFLAASHVVWLGRGIAGDDTHGHVDDIARFAGPHTVVAAVEPRTDDPNHEPLADNLRRLQAGMARSPKATKATQRLANGASPLAERSTSTPRLAAAGRWWLVKKVRRRLAAMAA